MPRKKTASSGTIHIKNGRVTGFELKGQAADRFVKGLFKAHEEADELKKKIQKETKKP